ncbi:MAG: Cof-type HAD-IIB family hydrolase [Synergistaceae bacterium]
MSYKPKLIAVDIDGTILNSNTRLTERTKLALQKAMTQGIHVITATGRMYPSALPFVKQIGMTSPCVFYNGAAIRNPITGETIYEKSLGINLTRDVIGFYHDHGWYVQIYYNDKLFVMDSTDTKCKYYESIVKVKAIPMGIDFWDFDVDATKLLGIALDEKTFQKMARVTKGRFAHRLHASTSWSSFVEMVHSDVNKAYGVEMAAKTLGIKREDIMAFGDAGNDKEMIEWAGCGVAMGNAPQYLKDMADIVAPTNDDDGVAQIIEKFLN